MILGTGIDIIEVERVKRAAAKEGFMERVFTATKCNQFGNLRNVSGIFNTSRTAGIS